MKNSLLNICKNLWIIILIILAVIIFIFEFNIILWLLSFIDINNIIATISNLIIAVCAILALRSWEKELNKKREYEAIDYLLNLIINAQNLLTSRFYRALLGLHDTNEDSLNKQNIQGDVINLGKDFEFISLKFKTMGKDNLSNYANNLSKMFQEFVDVQHDRNEPFYEAYLHNYNGFKAKVDKALLEAKQNCI